MKNFVNALIWVIVAACFAMAVIGCTGDSTSGRPVGVEKGDTVMERPTNAEIQKSNAAAKAGKAGTPSDNSKQRASNDL